MKKGWIIGLSIVGVILLTLIIFISMGVKMYNNFVTLNEDVNTSWAQVQSDYQRRADLIPNLVNTVKGYANFEQKTITDVTEARSRVGSLNMTKEVLNDPAAFQRFQHAQSELGGAISRLLVTVENYPNLKANENFLSLQAQLEGTENRIKVARNKFNETVRTYNTYIKKFPEVVLAGIFGFRDKAYFQAAAGSENAPKVEF
ncbi:MAG: LemA family protein [Ignavibacteria bacterium]|nr:LemA family protein [Ignavibacteria bacterium]